jgi:photosystem II stability/assembly factor-like uncharacterized protein
MGDTWSAINVPVATDLQSVSFVDSQIGYASGTDSQVVKTTNAGLTWTPVTRPSTTNYTLQAVDFIDANTGWVFVNFINVPGGSIFKTTDGGTTWTQQTLGTAEQRIASADMVDASVGYVTLNPSGQPIYKTTNGGISWTPVSTPFVGQIKTVSAVDANLVYIGASFGTFRVGKSTDGGATWTQIALPATVDVVSLDFKDANTGYVCGNSAATAICKTTDGGATWSFQNSHTNTLVRVYAGPSGTGWALGASAAILRWAAPLGPTPTPTPIPTTPTPTPTPSPTATPTPTPTPTPIVCSAGAFSENFDSVTVPALPSGWSASNVSGAPPLWVTSNAGGPAPPADSGPNAVSIDDPSTVSDKRLDSVPVTIANPGPDYSFPLPCR